MWNFIKVGYTVKYTILIESWTWNFIIFCICGSCSNIYSFNWTWSKLSHYSLTFSWCIDTISHKKGCNEYDVGETCGLDGTCGNEIMIWFDLTAWSTKVLNECCQPETKGHNWLLFCHGREGHVFNIFVLQAVDWCVRLPVDRSIYLIGLRLIKFIQKMV